MNRNDLLNIAKDMNMTEKAMQMTQLSSGLICHTQLSNLTGPFREWSFTNEELESIGSVLGAHGADEVIRVQKEYLEIKA